MTAESKDTLEEALQAYEGPLVTVSHDRWFLDQVVNRIWEVNEGNTYYGNYTDYVRAKKASHRSPKKSVKRWPTMTQNLWTESLTTLQP